MPLRDHFRSPVDDRHNWSALHATWPVCMVQQLRPLLPPGYLAEPGTHLGRVAEVDIATFEDDAVRFTEPDGSGGTAVMSEVAAEAPTFTTETHLADLPQFEVLVYDLRRARQLVAAVEIVSPANKDRPEHRRAFAAKWAGLLQRQVCVIVVDPVTTFRFSLYAELLDLTGHRDPAIGREPATIYTATSRVFTSLNRPRWHVWHRPLALGAPLPPATMWLRDDLHIPLDLEGTYESACQLLGIE